MYVCDDAGRKVNSGDNDNQSQRPLPTSTINTTATRNSCPTVREAVPLLQNQRMHPPPACPLLT